MTHERHENVARVLAVLRWAARLSAALVAVALLAGPMAGQESTKLTIEDIRKAWQQRQDKVKSARIVYTERATLTKGSIEDQMRTVARMNRKRKQKSAIPLPVVKDVTFDVPSYFLLDGKKAFLSSESSEVSMTTGTLAPSPLVSSYDSKTETTLRPKGSPTLSIPQAHITPASRSMQIRNPPLIPLVMTFRPFVSDLRLLNLDAFTLTGRQSVIVGKPCVELYLDYSGGAGTHCWVDPSRDCVIVRLLTVSEELTVEKFDIRYQPDAKAGWVPESWETVFQMGKEDNQQKSICTVSKCEVNGPIEAREFKIDFPLGTRVKDEVKGFDYIVKPAGGNRVILDEDIGATYEQMLNSEPGEALVGPRRRAWIPWAIGLCLCSVVGMSLWWLKRNRRRAVSPTGNTPVPRDA